MGKLLIICGQEGTGKSTIAKAILPHLKNGAAFDAENILQVNPFEFDEKFKQLAIDNSAVLINSFFGHGCERVVAGSFIGDRAGYDAFKTKLEHSPKVFIVMLVASQEVRDKRRMERAKPTTKEWRDIADAKAPKDTTLGAAKDEYDYYEIDNSGLTVDETIAEVKKKIPDFF